MERLQPVTAGVITALVGYERINKLERELTTEEELLRKPELWKLLGVPRVPLATLIDWQADWIARGLPGLGKPTHFETRDGKY